MAGAEHMLPEMRQGGAGSLSVDNNFFFYHDESSITVYLVDVSDVGEASLLCPLGKKQSEDASPANYILLSETAIFYLEEILTRLIYGGTPASEFKLIAFAIPIPFSSAFTFSLI
jgi:hypothetical protein